MTLHYRSRVLLAIRRSTSLSSLESPSSSESFIALLERRVDRMRPPVLPVGPTEEHERLVPYGAVFSDAYEAAAGDKDNVDGAAPAPFDVVGGVAVTVADGDIEEGAAMLLVSEPLRVDRFAPKTLDLDWLFGRAAP